MGESREEKYHRREELVGKEVYDAKAKKLGIVVDIGYSKEGRTALVVGIATAGMVDSSLSDEERLFSHPSKERFETLVFERVSEIGDIILLKAESETEVEQAPDSALSKMTETIHTKPCPECDRENEKLAKFCVECGYDFREEKSSRDTERTVDSARLVPTYSRHRFQFHAKR